MKYYKYLLTQLLILSSLAGLLGQTNKKTLNYQAVILDPKAIDIPGASIVGQPLNKGNVCLRFSLLNAQGGLDYEETQSLTTDEYGLVNVAIGAGAQAQSGNSTSIYKSFDSVVWNSSVKSLKVSVSYDGCSSFKQVSSQAFNYTPYALYAESVDYKNVRDAPTKLSQFSNDPGYIIPKDLDPLKADIKSNTSQLATANQTIADNKKSSDAAFLIVNQSITSLDTQVAANTTALKETSSSIGTINTKLSDQQNQITATNNNLNTQIGGLQGQLNTTNSTVSNLTGVAEVVSNKSTSVNLGGANPSDQLYPSQKAAKSYIDNAIYDAVGSGVPDATTLAAGKVKLAGDLGGTAASPTVPALANKENITNKSTAIDLGAGNPSDQLYPSQKATKAYVDNSIYQAVGSGVPDATTNAAGKLKLAGDLAGTASNPTVPGLISKEDVSNKSNSTSLGTSTTSYPTQHAVKAYVDAQIANATIADANSSTKGKIKLAGALGGTADAPTVPGLVLKEDVANKSAAADLGAGSTSDDKYPSQKAVKTYVDNQVATATIADASSTSKGKLQLAGDLAGTAAAPLIAAGAINSSKIEDRSIATDDIADLAITNGKIDGVAGSKVSGNIAGNAANVTGLVAVSNGGTGASNLTGYVKGNGTSAMTTVSSIPVADVTGAVKKVNGSLPNASGEVSILFGRVTSGNYANVPTTGGVNGDIYIVSGDGNASQNGRTFIKDDANWNEVSPNTAATDARYLQLGGGVMEGNISVPTGKKVTLTDAPTGSTDATNKNYVDTKIASEVPYASTTVVGKIQLAGDLGGTYLLPTVPGLADKAPKNDPAFTGTVTGITKAMVNLANVDNTSDANKPVSNATLTALNAKAPIVSPSFSGTATFSGNVSGITKTMVGLGSVDNTSDLAKPVSTSTQTALDAKENTSNKSNDVTLGTSTTAYPTQNAVKTYVDNSVTSGSPDADVSTKGKVQLAGDLTGTAALPVIATGVITSAKILDATIATADLADNSITSAKIANGEIVNADISSTAAIADSKLATIGTIGKVSNSATTATNANTASAIVARDANGNFSAGTITANGFTGALTGNAATATSAISFTSNLVGDVTGTQTSTVVGKINGTSLAGLATGLLKNTTSTGVPTIATAGTDYQAPITITTIGTGAATLSGNTLNIPAVSSTVNAGSISGTVAVTNGGTGAITPEAALTALGAQALVNLSTNIATDASSLTKYPAVKTIKEYVDGSVTSGAPDANATTKGKVQLAGDLGGTASSPTVNSVGGVSSSTIANFDTRINSTTASISSLISNSVPYTGATAGVNLGAYDLTVNGLTIGIGAATISPTNNTAFGYNVLANNTTGTNNIANGYSALNKNSTGANNLAIGVNALTNNTSGSNNTSIGFYALAGNSAGSYNSAVGGNALYNNTGGYNVAIGNKALYTNTIGNYNTAIGYMANVGSNNLENATAIGNSAIVTASNTIQLGNASVTNVKTSGTLTTGAVTYPNTHAGTSGQVLTSLGSGTLTWTTPSSTATAYSGTLPVSNGGTGNSIATQNYIFAGPATGSTAAAPGFRALVAADIPASAISYDKIQNISTGKLLGSISASATAPGEVTIGTGLSLSNGTLAATGGGTVTSVAALNLTTTGADITSSVATASTTPSITLNIPDASATARGVVTTGAQTIAGAKTFSGNTAIGGTLNVSGVTTLTSAPVLSSTTASQALFTDANKNVVSKATTGSGNVVMQTSPQLVTPDLGTPSLLVGTNITGTAANFTAGNISATSNTTLTSINTLATVGTLTGGSINLATDIKTSGKLVAGTVTYPNTHNLTAGQILKVDAAGTASWAANTSVNIFSDEPSSITAGQTSFNLSNIPLSNKVWMYINGTRISKNAYSVSVSGTTASVTYVPSSNNSYTLIVGDRIQFDYVY